MELKQFYNILPLLNLGLWVGRIFLHNRFYSVSSMQLSSKVFLILIVETSLRPHQKCLATPIGVATHRLGTNGLTDEVSDLSPYLSRLHFIQCQLANVLVHKNRRKYNVITQAMALKAHLTSPSCYRYLQSLDCLCLPRVIMLQQLYSKIGLESDFTTLLKQLRADFCSKERSLILHMDEIHINSNVAYTGGRILGYYLESNKPIKTVFAIKASSLYRKWSQVIRTLLFKFSW